MPMLTIAALTVREAVRRRVAAIVAAMSLLFVVLIAWGFWKLNGAIREPIAATGADAGVTILVTFMFSVVLGIGSAFLASGSIASEIESGVALSVLPRPISRTEYVAGKWLGLVSLVTTYAAVFGTLAFVAIARAAGYHAPHPAGALLFVVAQSIALLTISLLLSTRLPALAGGVISVALFGVSWIAGITAGIARALHADVLDHAASAAGLLVPTDGLWRGAVFDLTPVALQVASASTSAAAVNPFGVTNAPPHPFLAWCVLWIAAMFGAATWSMRTRDL